MGHLHYGPRSFSFDDRLLAHLQIVFSLKLRRGEDFFFSWRNESAAGDGRHSIWIDNGIPLHFEYSGSRTASINREWIESLSVAANSSSGLTLTDDTRSGPTPA